MQKKSRPDKVSTALTLLWIYVAVGVVKIIMEFPNMLEVASAQGAGLRTVIFTIFLLLAIPIFLIFMIGERKNWARIIFLVLLVLGIPYAITPLLQLLLRNPFSGILEIGKIILQLIAMVLLFQKPSSDWFKSLKK